MGKPTGFIDYKRQELELRLPKERMQDWQEIKPSSIGEQDFIRQQAARCMNCGIPFCQSGIILENNLSGCPLHNLMPEFNDLVYQGLDFFAYNRLIATNNFPEFTSHVCPAPCEGACSAGLATSPVCIKNIEQYIIETAFAKGYVEPEIPEKRSDKKIAVIGSGPAGLSCADQLNRAGHNVTIYERADRPGGLLMYGIPNMKLGKDIVTRRIAMLKKAGIKFKLNSEVGYKISSETLSKQFDAIVLCTGSTVPRDLPIPGRNLKGIYFAKDYLESATKTLLGDTLDEHTIISARDKDVVVIGGGDTGTDCVATAIRQGCKSIKQIEIMPCLPHSRQKNNPWPQMPRTFKTDYGQEEAFELYHQDPREYCIMSKEFVGKNGHITKLRCCQVQWKQRSGRQVPVEISDTEQLLPAQLVILAMGFTGCESILFDEFKFAKSPTNTIATDQNNYMTSIPGIFAAGDSRRGQSLVVWAIAEGRAAAKAVNVYLQTK
ncbi:MAG: glutamate synthase subunit beta [Phascolarctobacterium sp.]|nr:glutamate synthase subunit beta [Phascolarctobacterium sp.]